MKKQPSLGDVKFAVAYEDGFAVVTIRIPSDGARELVDALRDAAFRSALHEVRKSKVGK